MIKPMIAWCKITLLSSCVGGALTSKYDGSALLYDPKVQYPIVPHIEIMTGYNTPCVIVFKIDFSKSKALHSRKIMFIN